MQFRRYVTLSTPVSLEHYGFGLQSISVDPRDAAVALGGIRSRALFGDCPQVSG
jgi:hypothetical protein